MPSPESERHLPGGSGRGGSLTTLADVHAEEGELGALGADAVEVLAVQRGLALLPPQLHPADVTAAGEEVLLQPPVGKKMGRVLLSPGGPAPSRAVRGPTCSSGVKEKRGSAWSQKK